MPVVERPVYQAFRKSGVPEDLAAAAARAIPDSGTVATKPDLERLQAGVASFVTRSVIALALFAGALTLVVLVVLVLLVRASA